MANQVKPEMAERGAFGGQPSRALLPHSGNPSLKWRAKAPSGLAEQVVATDPPLEEGDTSKRSGAPVSTQASAKAAANSPDTTPLAKRFTGLDE
jgi:hypothetical protein